MIFGDYYRTDKSTRRSTESSFAFLDRCSWKAAQQIRELLEECLSRYPPAEQYELEARISSAREHTFASAVFELFLHESLLRQGFHLTPHPKLDHSEARPDFLVHCPDGDFYLEAVLAAERGGLDLGSRLRIDSTLDGLDDTPHPNFLVLVDYEGAPSTQPSASKLRNAVLKWLDELDPDATCSPRPRMEWSHEGWSLVIEAIPVKRERRGKTTRLLAGYSGEGGISDGWTGIRDAVKHKTSKYGDLDKPFLIAVNYGSVFLDQIDELQALYGQEQILVSIHDPQRDSKLTRIPNGAWHGRSGPTGRRASGAWIFKGLNQYNAASCSQAIYANPWAKHELPRCLRAFPYFSVIGNRLIEEEGLTFGEALGLNPDWLDESDRS